MMRTKAGPVLLSLMAIAAMMGAVGTASARSTAQFSNRDFANYCRSNMDDCREEIEAVFFGYAFAGTGDIGGCPPEGMSEEAEISAIIGWWTMHPDQYATRNARPGESIQDNFAEAVDAAEAALWPCKD